MSTLKDSAAGPDGLPVKFLRELVFVITVPLSIIFGQSYFSKTVPDMRRNAIVIPIYKRKGDRKDPNNYRPISLMCIPCKIMETLITATTMSHMEFNQYLSDSQYGFRKGRSTTSLLLKSINDHITCLDNEYDVDVIYLDFAKAFGSVDHALLLQKFSWYNLQPNIICRISNFLSGRSQKVRLGNVCSDCIPVPSGVVQGSSVGVTLFLIFINDLPLCVKFSKLYLFADDPKLFHSISSPEDVCLPQSDLDSIYQWSSK